VPFITDPHFYAAAIPAVILVGLAKGGFGGLGLLSLPLMALVIPPLQAAAIMLPILLVQDVVSVGAFRRHVSWRNLKILVPSAGLGVVLAYLLAAWVSDAAVKLAIGLLSLAFASRSLFGAAAHAPAVKGGILAGWFWGAACGFTSLISHAGGPPFQVYVLPQRLPRDTFIGTGAILFALINWMKLPPYIALGVLTRENLATAAMLFPLAIASTWAGVWLVRRVRGEHFFRIIYALLVLVGLKLIWDGGRALAGA
jgi:uncharacterized protein